MSRWNQATRDWTPTLVHAACVLKHRTLDDVRSQLKGRMSGKAFDSFIAGRKPTRSERFALETVLGDWLGNVAIIKVPQDGDIGYFGVAILTKPFKPGTPSLDLEKVAAKHRGEA